MARRAYGYGFLFSLDEHAYEIFRLFNAPTPNRNRTHDNNRNPLAVRYAETRRKLVSYFLRAISQIHMDRRVFFRIVPHCRVTLQYVLYMFYDYLPIFLRFMWRICDFHFAIFRMTILALSPKSKKC